MPFRANPSPGQAISDMDSSGMFQCIWTIMICARGQQVSDDFEGCIRLLTDMNLIAQAPENRRSDQQRQKAARFREFGCTFCHQITPGKAGLTEVGAKLTRMHLGCVDVEKLVAGSPARH